MGREDPGREGTLRYYQNRRADGLQERCPNLVRTLPTLVHKEGDPDDLTGEDHAADALRYGLMQQPEVKRPSLQPNPPSDFEAKKTRELAMRRQRIAEKGYIGSEFVDPRLFNYRRRGLYNPSDR